MPKWLFSHFILLAAVLPVAGFAQQNNGPTQAEIRGLLAALQDSAPHVQVFALDYVRREQVEAAVPQTLRLLRHPHPHVQKAAAEALARIGLDERYRPILQGLLDSRQPAQYAAVARVLGAAGWLDNGEAATLAGLFQQTQGEYVVYRTNALYALGSLGPAASAFAPDVEFMAFRAYQSWDFDPHLRRGQWEAALHALGEFGPAGAPHLLNLLTTAEADSIGFEYCELIGRSLMRTGTSEDSLMPGLLTRIADPGMGSGCALGVLSSLHAFAKAHERSVYSALGVRGDSIADQLLLNVFRRSDMDYLYRALEGRVRGGVPHAAPFIAVEQPDLLRANVGRINDLLTHRQSHPVLAGSYLLSSMNALPMGSGTRALELAFRPFASTSEEELALLTVLGLDQNRLRIEAKPFEDSIFNYARAIFDLEVIKHCRQWNPTLPIHTVGLPEHAPLAATLMSRMAPLDAGKISAYLRIVYPDSSEATKACFTDEYAGLVRFYAYMMTGGDPDNVLLVRFLGRSGNNWSNQTDRGRVLKLVRNILSIWDDSETPGAMRAEAAPLLAAIVRQGRWNSGDRALLDTIQDKLRAGRFLDEADAVRARLTRGRVEAILGMVGRTTVVYAVLWLLIFVAYPHSRWVQTNVVWHPKVRKGLGLGLPGYLITTIPLLRRRILQPFAGDLRTGLHRHVHADDPYFPDVTVKEPSGEIRPVLEALSDLRGRIVLQGKSGIGKTVFVRELVQRSSRPVVYLPARGCEDGVIAAIGRLVPGGLSDRDFLERLVQCGGLDVCIDGLNEASIETRAKINHFFESVRRANVLITTQPLEWSPPAGARVYELQPLGANQIRSFLLHQGRSSDISEPLGYAAFEVACNRYLEELMPNDQNGAVWAEMVNVLANPMDLTVVARLLARRVWPDLLQLHRQQFEVMEQSYSARNGGAPFPLSRFAEAVYRSRCDGHFRIPDGFPEEVLALRDAKMISGREMPPESGERRWVYYFRHDKVAEFFLAEHFAGTGREQVYDHIADPRFRGVYLLLASRFDVDRAAELKEVLVDYAAESGDHTLSDAYVLRHRAWLQLGAQSEAWRNEQARLTTL